MEPKGDDWKTVDMLAGEVGVHVKTLIRWAARGLKGRKLAHRRLGVKYQTTKAHLDAFFAAGAQACVPAALAAPTAPAVPLSRQRRADKAAREALGM